MKRKIISVLCALFVCFFMTSCNRGTQTQIRIDGQSGGRVFEGAGAVSAGASSRLLIDYPEPQRSQVLDYLFKPNYGAALQHLKVEIGGDTNSTDGSEPSHMHTRGDLNYHRGYEWWLMKEAKKRNPDILLDSLPWGAPGWIGNGKYYSQDMADYVLKFLQGAKKVHGLDINYTGVWNEKNYDPEWIKLLRKTLDSGGFSTGIVAADLYEHQWDIVDLMKTDSALNGAVYAIGAHYPRVNGKVNTTQAAKDSGKPLWSSEDQPPFTDGGGISSRDWAAGGKGWANTLNTNYIEGRMTKTENWSPVTSYYDNLAAPHSGLMYANTPWSGHYNVQAAIWVTAHTTQFAQPGWRYIDSACGYLKGKGSFVTLKSPSSNNYSVVIETMGAPKSQEVSFQIAGGLSEGVVHVWRTNAGSTFERQGDLTPQNGSFTIMLDRESLYSLTTTSGQRKGIAEAPPDSSFPFPYADDFDGDSLGGTPKYLSDQNGAFEVVRCVKRRGQCLRQVVDTRPISWGIDPDPYTFLGSADWADYQISSDVLLEEPGQVTLLGRIDSADYFIDGKARWPSAYILSVHQDGQWELFNSKYKAPTTKLAAGKVSFSANTWHHLEFAFKGSTIEAFIDGKPMASVKDTTHKTGMAGIGTGWNKAQFDKFSVR